MRPADPFTSTNARVLATPESQANAALEREGQLARNALGNLFGDRGEVQFRQYYGEEGRWRCGYRSEFGFHVRGRGLTAMAAVEDARGNKIPGDPGLVPISSFVCRLSSLSSAPQESP